MLLLIFCLVGVITLWGMVCWNVLSCNRVLAPAGNPKKRMDVFVVIILADVAV